MAALEPPNRMPTFVTRRTPALRLVLSVLVCVGFGLGVLVGVLAFGPR